MMNKNKNKATKKNEKFRSDKILDRDLERSLEIIRIFGALQQGKCA